MQSINFIFWKCGLNFWQRADVSKCCFISEADTLLSFLMIPLHNLALHVQLWIPGQSFLSHFSAYTSCIKLLYKERGGLAWDHPTAEVCKWFYSNMNITMLQCFPRSEHLKEKRLNLGLNNRRCFNKHHQFVIIPSIYTVQFTSSPLIYFCLQTESVTHNKYNSHTKWTAQQCWAQVVWFGLIRKEYCAFTKHYTVLQASWVMDFSWCEAPMLVHFSHI